MASYKVLLIALAVALLGLAAYFLLAGNVGTDSTLSRSEAARKIEEYIMKGTGGRLTQTAKYFDGTGLYSSVPVGYAIGGGADDAKIKELEQRGLITIKGYYPSFGTIVDFTDDAKPYLSASDAGDTEILFGTLKDVEIVGLTESQDGSGQKSLIAEYVPRFELTPFGEVLRGSAAGQVRMPFVLYDDGWRISLSPM